MMPVALPSAPDARKHMARRLRDKATDIRKSGIHAALTIAESANELAALIEHCDRHYPTYAIEPDRSVPMRGIRPVALHPGSPAGLLLEV